MFLPASTISIGGQVASVAMVTVFTAFAAEAVPCVTMTKDAHIINAAIKRRTFMFSPSWFDK
jgi:hypothetical protein